MKKFTAYPSIDQFRTTIKYLQKRFQYVGKNEDGDPIYDEDAELPTITFNGTVKLHGTNAAIGHDGEGIWFQSRTGIVTPLKDNQGFATFFSSKEKLEKLEDFFIELKTMLNVSYDDTIVVYGEWCGGKIQKGVALNELSKRFVVFGIKQVFEDDVNIWHPIDDVYDHSMEIYNILNYEQYSVDVDLHHPTACLPKLDKLIEEIENECPFAKAFGKSGIGEGIVFTHTDDEGNNHRFKYKGEKHSVVNKKQKDPMEVEKLNSINEFVEYAVTENRLEQGIEQVFTINDTEPDIKKTGDFLKWLVQDIVKEEIDTLSENGLTLKEVTSFISKKGRDWYFDYLNRLFES